MLNIHTYSTTHRGFGTPCAIFSASKCMRSVQPIPFATINKRFIAKRGVVFIGDISIYWDRHVSITIHELAKWSDA